MAFNTAVAATIISLLRLPLAHADDRPPGIPDEAKYVKVDRVIDKLLEGSPSTPLYSGLL
jgi:hypothetical protein